MLWPDATRAQVPAPVPVAASRCLLVSTFCDETIDRAALEAPMPASLHQVIVVGTPGPDDRAVWAVLHQRPVGPDRRSVAVQRDHDVGGEMHPAWPRSGGDPPRLSDDACLPATT